LDHGEDLFSGALIKTPQKMKWMIIPPSRKLTYPTWGKGKSSSKWTFRGIC